MTYQDRVDAALTMIREHNDVVGEGNPGFVDGDKFVASLKAYSAISEEDLKRLSWEKILKILEPALGADTQIKPQGLAEKLALIFRDKKEEKSDSRPASSKKAERMTPKELVETFDAEEFSSPVGKRLESLSRGEPFIVFESGRIVDINTTFRLLMEVKEGYDGRRDIEVDGAIKPVYQIGDLPDSYADENPIYEGRPLRPDGTCDQTGRSWAGVTLNIRQFVRMALNKKLIEPNIDDSHKILDMALEPDALSKLRRRYRDASLIFDELTKTGNLPLLQLSLKTQREVAKEESSGGNRHPFEGAKRVEWVVPNNPTANYFVNRCDIRK